MQMGYKIRTSEVQFFLGTKGSNGVLYHQMGYCTPKWGTAGNPGGIVDWFSGVIMVCARISVFLLLFVAEVLFGDYYSILFFFFSLSLDSFINCNTRNIGSQTVGRG